ncbi:MAG: thioredoxin domain-containing protein [Sulfurospirillaceae bacterium]|nr:thioredoxin domain-containing protein [Sulfurospirillaceae bacterium]
MKIVKIAAIGLVMSGALFASSNLDQKVINFEKQRFMTHKNLTLTKVEIVKKAKVPYGEWYGYILSIQANVPGHGMVSGHDTIFSNGEIVAPELVNMKSGDSFKSLLSLKVTSAYYKPDHLIAGNINAKNKVVVFSDPLCPFCIKALPGIIKKAKDNPNKIALYYYQFPLLSIHPASDVVTKAMIVAKREGIKNVEAKIYNADLDKHLSVSEKNRQKILDNVNKVLKTNITLKDISDASLNKEIRSDMKMGADVMVRGTPTIFVNGVKDTSRTIFQNL